MYNLSEQTIYTLNGRKTVKLHRLRNLSEQCICTPTVAKYLVRDTLKPAKKRVNYSSIILSVQSSH